MTSSSLRVQVVVDLLKKHEVSNIVFSPGSRNAPLVIGFNGDDYFKSKIIVDERSAAFFALGIAQQIQKPVVICSTSGSAVLNYAPAIVEAYYQKIPLLVITADRPPEWVNQGEGQSMKQYKVYENYIAKSFNLPMLDHPDALWQTGVIINEAVHIANNFSKPVHINFPFREPLYETVIKPTHSEKKIIHHITQKKITPSDLTNLKKSWETTDKKMIICGSLNKNTALNTCLSNLNKDPSVVILTEPTSNLYDQKFISCIDRTLERINDSSYYPDLVVSIGNSIISKKIKTLLRKNKPLQHWHVEDTNRAQDVFSALTNFIPLAPDVFFNDLIKKNPFKLNSNYKKNWYNQFLISEKNHQKYLNMCNWSDLKVHQVIHSLVPKIKINIQMGNCTSVRYMQLFKHLENVSYYSNRGVSGIDGSSSTAVGAASISKTETILITGDLSFIYDQNALWSSLLPKNLKIIVLNNQGGGIFNIISGPRSTPYKKENFETPHELSLEKIAGTFKINYQKATNEQELKISLNKIFKSKELEILECFTGKVKNEDILNKYFREIKKN